MINQSNTSRGHTPGPWSLPHFARPEVNCKCGYVLSDGYMGAVATVHCSGEGDGSDWRQGDNPKFDEAVANAHLIAAAPDMFSASESLIASLDPDTLNPEQFNAWCDLRNAISKAQGTPS